MAGKDVVVGRASSYAVGVLRRVAVAVPVSPGARRAGVAVRIIGLAVAVASGSGVGVGVDSPTVFGSAFRPSDRGSASLRTVSPGKQLLMILGDFVREDEVILLPQGLRAVHPAYHGFVEPVNRCLLGGQFARW